MSRLIFPQATISLSNFFIISLLILLSNGAATTAQDSIKVIGAIINMNSRVGKEARISMEIAIQTFNNALSNKYKLTLHVIDSGGKPLQALRAAEALMEMEQVQAIVGMETWREAALVAEATKDQQIPILSFATPSIIPPLTSVRWPFLVRVANNETLQMECVASIVGSYGWRRVIAIYEDDGYSTDSGILKLLSDALQTVGSEIEHALALPPFATLIDPEAFIQEELQKLNRQQSRVFIIVGSSLELAYNVLSKAKDAGLIGKDSVWITTGSVTDLLHTVNSSVISSMQGVIGIRTHFPETTPIFFNFSKNFRNLFQSIYPEEDKYKPGIYALRAYDTISSVILAIQNTTDNSSTTTSRTLLENILFTNFSGLSGKIQFRNKELSLSATYEITNVVGKTYIVLKLWSPDCGFTGNVTDEMSTQESYICGAHGGTIRVLGGKVHWPGGLEREPLGWLMPDDAKPMVIGVPGRTSFEKFVKVTDGEEPTGFCIDVFKNALKLLNYDLPHVFVPFNGTYDDMVDQVYLKRFDAVVGDITILANRSNYVEFTQPYAESGLTMLVPVKTEKEAWLFLTPFTTTLWIVVIFVFVYTMFVVWFLEHRSNPEFRGPWKNQLGTAMWFTFSTLFFAHKESLRSNYTRAVMFIWFFVVFIITSSYTASLTSMLTVKRLEPTVTDFETLRRSNAPVGKSFQKRNLENTARAKP